MKKLRPETLRSKSSVAIIVTVAVLIEVILIIQFVFARNGIREEVEHRAETELRVKNLEIQKVMVAVETAISNTVWAAERSLEQPDSLYSVLRRMVKANQTIVGAGLMFTADYYPQKGHWFEPYVAQRADGTIEEAQIGSESHNYLNAEFYENGINAGKGRWSEPYYDDTGAKMMLCTYTVPVNNLKGETVALLGADVSLEWLSGVINASHIYPSSYNVVISRTGMVMVCPDESLIMRSTIQEITESATDTITRYINQQQMAGKSGHQDITDIHGEEISVFYAPIDGETGWSMSVVCSQKEIYSNLQTIGLYLMLLMVAGMALLGYIIYRTARSARTLQAAQVEKERIGSELRIARGIQESMLPKTFPPFPERNDVDIFASLVPAKEVGGDLYDFYIRDGKLFFCIGDVSGKGVPASLVMAVTRSLFRTVSAREDMPTAIVTAMNESMADMNDSDMFVTFFVGVLDLTSGKLQCCNAGHEDPLLIGRGIGLLPTKHNVPLGLQPGWKYEGHEVQIYRESTIFLYTDGLTEAEDSSHAQFGKQRMIETARQVLKASHAALHSNNLETLIALQTDALHRFVGNAEQSDDITMLAIKFRGVSASESSSVEG
ncbi:MAG: SpoIIE family protein phosphatase [Bacteroidaceae bacterium]|nr:SpoIIE family protein phosphatase [Bacteroidaceae bacterium]